MSFENHIDTSFAVIKIGGGIVSDSDLLDASVTAIKDLVSIGYVPTLVHGGGPQINEQLRAVEGEPQFRDGLRLTSRLAINHIAQSLAEVNQLLVTRLHDEGVEAVGLENVFGADYLDRAVYGEVGRVTSIEEPSITEALRQHQVPVISCLAHYAVTGYLNVNGDDAAAALVRALHPLKYISFTPTGGVLDTSGNVVHNITPDVFATMLKDGSINGGMQKKVDEAFGLINSNVVDSVVIVHPEHLMDELFTNKGRGTLVTK